MFGFGVRQDGARIVERPKGQLPSLREMLESEPGSYPEQWARSWIVPDVIEFGITDGVMKVKRVKMKVRALRQVPDRASKDGLRDVPTDPKSLEARWAARATELYDTLAASAAPQWAQIREVSKALAIAHWLRETGAKVDMSEVINVINASRESVAKMTAVDLTFTRTSGVPFEDARGRGERVTTTEIRLFGGANPDGNPRLTRDPSTVSLRKIVLEAMATAPVNGSFEVRDGTSGYVASVMPFRVELRRSAQ